MKNFKCYLFGHKICNVSLDLKQAKCKRCDKKLEVIFDFKGGKLIIWK